MGQAARCIHSNLQTIRRCEAGMLHIVRDIKSYLVVLEVIREVISLTRQMCALMRPMPSWSKHKTPIDNLHLCGSGVHGGGGVSDLLVKKLPHQKSCKQKPGRQSARFDFISNLCPNWIFLISKLNTELPSATYIKYTGISIRKQ